MMKLTERSLLGTGHTGDAYWWLMPVSETTVVCASHRKKTKGVIWKDYYVCVGYFRKGGFMMVATVKYSWMVGAILIF